MDILIQTQHAKKQMPEFSDLQKQIIQFLQTGLTSDEILLLTHSTHQEMTQQRKQILNKTNCVTMFDVISRANKQKWF